MLFLTSLQCSLFFFWLKRRNQKKKSEPKRRKYRLGLVWVDRLVWKNIIIYHYFTIIIIINRFFAKQNGLRQPVFSFSLVRFSFFCLRRLSGKEREMNVQGGWKANICLQDVSLDSFLIFVLFKYDILGCDIIWK